MHTHLGNSSLCLISSLLSLSLSLSCCSLISVKPLVVNIPLPAIMNFQLQLRVTSSELKTSHKIWELRGTMLVFAFSQLIRCQLDRLPRSRLWHTNCEMSAPLHWAGGICCSSLHSLWTVSGLGVWSSMPCWQSVFKGCNISDQDSERVLCQYRQKYLFECHSEILR